MCGTIEALDRSPWRDSMTVELQVSTPHSDGPDQVHYQAQQTLLRGEAVAFRFRPPSNTPSNTRFWSAENSARWRILVKNAVDQRTPELEYDILAFSRDKLGDES